MCVYVCAGAGACVAVRACFCDLEHHSDDDVEGNDADQSDKRKEEDGDIGPGVALERAVFG
jgi:hypothetical protein